MRTKRILIVEDNIDSSKMLEKLVEEIDETAICYVASNVSQAYEIIHKQVIDVFLLDIILDTKDLGDVSGIELAEEIRRIDRYKFAPIIFITSLADPKMYAYSSIHSYKYIEKPFQIEETKAVIKDALCYETRKDEVKYDYFKRDGILFAVREHEIVYVESKFHVMYIYTIRDKLTIYYKTCKDMLEILDEEDFVQCNRNTIVNRKYIKSIDKCNRYIGLQEEYGSIKIGKKYLKQVLDKCV